MTAPKPPAVRAFAFKSGGRITLEARAESQTAEIMVYGYIGETYWEESVTARNVVNALNALTGHEVTVRIMSMGGSVADGVAIYNALRAMSARGVKVITRNEGTAYSIAGVILMAGDEVQSYANASFMVHAPWTYAAGDADSLRNVAEYLDTLAKGVATSYARKTGKGDEHALALMTNGKDNFFTAAEAQAEGFVDVVIDADAGPDVVEPQAHARTSPALAALFPDLQQHTAAACARLVLNPLAAARGSHPEHTMPPANPAPATSPAATLSPEEAVAQAKASARARIDGIRAAFAVLGASRTEHSTLEADCLADETVTVELAGQRVIEALAKKQNATPTGGLPRTEAGDDARDHLREGMANAMLHRANPQAYKLDEKGRKYQGMNLVRMAEEACAAAGMKPGHLPGKIAAQALHSTSDFPLILANVLGKTLRAAYEGTPRSFVPFSRRAVLPDFKEISRPQLGGAPNLKRIVEGGEYEYGSIGEAAEKYSVLKYGRKIAITWETIINDDLGAFTRIPEMFGRSAADLESDIVYALFNSNANMADGVPLFDAAHGNLGTAGAISETTLSEARRKMLLQKGIEGRYITVRPEFLIVPPSKLTEAQKIMTAITPDATSGVNVFAGSQQIIVEPRLEDASATAWYQAANPNAIDTIEYAYLEGYEGVFTETMNGFDVDGFVIKCRHVFGAKPIDPRGLFKNAGA